MQTFKVRMSSHGKWQETTLNWWPLISGFSLSHLSVIEILPVQERHLFAEGCFDPNASKENKRRNHGKSTGNREKNVRGGNQVRSD